MRFSFLFLAFLGILVLASVQAQTTFIPLWAKDGVFLDRLEIKAGTDNNLNLSTVKPYMRKAYVAVADSFRTLLNAGKNPAGLTKIDQYNLDRFQANNREFSRFSIENMPDWVMKKPLDKKGKHFFYAKSNAFEVNEKDFFLAVSPVVNFQFSRESNFDKTPFINTRGAIARGLIAKRIGFNFYLTDNQEQGPLQYRQFVTANRAVPGNGFWKNYRNGKGTDYFDARGSVSWNVTKYINMQFGYDKNFIGNGYRSLFLSDFSSNYLFLKFNTRIWKLNYTNIFMEMTPQLPNRRSDVLLNKKFASMHHLSFNAAKWLNVGLFESIIFGRKNSYELAYLNPVIFLRSIEGQIGSPDNANVGLDFKANFAKSFQVYGQFLLDELNVAEITKDRTWWGNKYGLQLGAKYLDVLGVSNLDLQVEWNRVRPFTYQHRDTVAAYTHYNQSLALPRGANIHEFIGILRWQPSPKLYFMGKGILVRQGLDSAGFNFGANPSSLYNRPPTGTRLYDYGYTQFRGTLLNMAIAQFNASYEVLENLFVDVSAMFRFYREDKKADINTSVISAGLRWNMFRREYDY
ncbi:MAG: hypothetical protein EAY75_11400 [Bacteroidetes bacterium]|nr:MAG: hypothetical protein EAY75_11400 [Bacteroidota bacterium]